MIDIQQFLTQAQSPQLMPQRQFQPQPSLLGNRMAQQPQIQPFMGQLPPQQMNPSVMQSFRQQPGDNVAKQREMMARLAQMLQQRQTPVALPQAFSGLNRGM